MLDRDVRGALYRHLEAEHQAEPDTVFVDELGLCHTVRVDVAVVNGALSAYELKSERDTLRRLPTQTDVYSRVVDYASLVCAPKHLERAAEIVHDWWGLVAAHPGDPVELEFVRPPAENPAVDAASVVQLLWRDEALAVLEEVGAAGGVRSKPRLVLWDRLVETLDEAELRRVVREALKAREGWRAERPPARGGAGSPGAATSSGSR